jgi:aminoglycoside phosphotransferase (APT) family kinase protein
VPALPELGNRLDRTDFVEPSNAAIVHGDYRLDNCIFTAEDPGTMTAVLGPGILHPRRPAADLGMLLFYGRVQLGASWS